jgi:hypothetical protein
LRSHATYFVGRGAFTQLRIHCYTHATHWAASCQPVQPACGMAVSPGNADTCHALSISRRVAFIRPPCCIHLSSLQNSTIVKMQGCRNADARDTRFRHVRRRDWTSAGKVPISHTEAPPRRDRRTAPCPDCTCLLGPNIRVRLLRYAGVCWHAFARHGRGKAPVHNAVLVSEMPRFTLLAQCQ